jgi:hypothetical protein
MKHKWHKEIKAWADGAEIEEKYVGGMCIKDWTTQNSPAWHTEIGYVYRIKPQPKKPQYINVYGYLENQNVIFRQQIGMPYIGKIKIEVDDE